MVQDVRGPRRADWRQSGGAVTRSETDAGRGRARIVAESATCDGAGNARSIEPGGGDSAECAVRAAERAASEAVVTRYGGAMVRSARVESRRSKVESQRQCEFSISVQRALSGD